MSRSVYSVFIQSILNVCTNPKTETYFNIGIRFEDLPFYKRILQIMEVKPSGLTFEQVQIVTTIEHRVRRAVNQMESGERRPGAMSLYGIVKFINYFK